MLIVFDEGTPVAIRHSLQGHTVRTVREDGWSDPLNSELLRVAEEAGFNVLITTDKKMVLAAHRYVGLGPSTGVSRIHSSTHLPST